MAIPWGRILSVALGVGDLALQRRAVSRSGTEDDRRLVPRALGGLETRLAGVVVAALKEAFDRDSRRIDLERQQLEAERVRAERALRLELLRQAGDRELARLRLTAGVAVAGWIGTLFLSARLMGGSAGPRLVLGVGWMSLLAALASAFAAQAGVGSALAHIDLDRQAAIPSSAAGTLAPWLIVLGLGLVGVAALIA